MSNRIRSHLEAVESARSATKGAAHVEAATLVDSYRWLSRNTIDPTEARVYHGIAQAIDALEPDDPLGFVLCTAILARAGGHLSCLADETSDWLRKHAPMMGNGVERLKVMAAKERAARAREAKGVVAAAMEEAAVRPKGGVWAKMLGWFKGE